MNRILIDLDSTISATTLTREWPSVKEMLLSKDELFIFKNNELYGVLMRYKVFTAKYSDCSDSVKNIPMRDFRLNVKDTVECLEFVNIVNVKIYKDIVYTLVSPNYYKSLNKERRS